MSTNDVWKVARHYEEGSWMGTVSRLKRHPSTNELIARRMKSQYDGERAEELPQRLQDLLSELDDQASAGISAKPKLWR